MRLLDFNVGIDFGKNGNLHEFGPVGFSAICDELSTWTEQPSAELLFRVPLARNDLRFTLQATPFLADYAGVTGQECWIYLNGLFAQFCRLTTTSEITFSMPREQIGLRSNRLLLVLPNAISPNELGVGDDLRQLGIACTQFRAAAI